MERSPLFVINRGKYQFPSSLETDPGIFHREKFSGNQDRAAGADSTLVFFSDQFVGDCILNIPFKWPIS
jgi:hypothetical protein